MIASPVGERISDLWARSCISERYEWPEFMLVLDPTLKTAKPPTRLWTLEDVLTLAHARGPDDYKARYKEITGEDPEA